VTLAEPAKIPVQAEDADTAKRQGQQGRSQEADHDQHGNPHFDGPEQVMEGDALGVEVTEARADREHQSQQQDGQESEHGVRDRQCSGQAGGQMRRRLRNSSAASFRCWR
jgi:hypothetical protein